MSVSECGLREQRVSVGPSVETGAQHSSQMLRVGNRLWGVRELCRLHSLSVTPKLV